MITSQNRRLAAARSSTRADFRHRDTCSGANALSARLQLLSTDIDIARLGSTNVLLIGPVVRCEEVIANQLLSVCGAST